MFLKRMDMLSPTITLYYKSENTHSSVISGILTIIAYVLIICFGIIYFLRYINRVNPTTYSFYRFVKDVGAFSFADLNFFNYVQLIKIEPREIIDLDFNKVDIIGINMTLESFTNSGNESIYPHWLYGKCDNETNIKGIEDLINKESFYKSACIKKFYDHNKSKYYDINDENFEWPSIKHGSANPNYTYYGILVRRCYNSSFRLKHFGVCSTDQEINAYLNRTFLSFYVTDNYIDVLNYKNPISKSLYSVTNKLEIDSFVTNNLNFNPALIKSYDILFNSDIHEEATYSFNQNSQTFSPTRDSNLLGAFYFWLQNSQQYYERRYKKLQDMLSEIGGLGSVIIMIAQSLNYLVSRFTMLSDTRELIFSLFNDNNSININERKSHNINQLFEENAYKRREEDKNIKINVNKENTENGKYDSNKNISKRIKVIKINNNLGEETNRMNKKDENSEYKIIKRHKSEAFEEITNQQFITYITINFEKISEKEEFNFLDYLGYKLFCKKIKPKIKYYEHLRKLVISEEIMFQNYLNINKLRELHQFN